VISASRYRFNGPDAIAPSGPDLFVANEDGNSITELNASTGSLVRVISASRYRFNGPDAIAPSGPDLFVANGGPRGALDGDRGPSLPPASGTSVTELNASTGRLVRVISASSYGFSGPHAIAVSGPDLFVANRKGPIRAEFLPNGTSVTELSASTGRLVRVISGSSYGFDGPDALAVSGLDLFVANCEGQSVTELRT
jgi:hypothetical protein